MWPKLVLCFTFSWFHAAQSDCVISMDDDFGNPQPVFLVNGSFWEPTGVVKNGGFELSTCDAVTVACPGTDRNIKLKEESIDLAEGVLKCVDDKTFKLDAWRGSFSDVRCSSTPSFEIIQTKSHCFGNNRIFQVGYRIEHKFHLIYELCFNEKTETTLFETHELRPSAQFTQTAKSLDFVEAGMFNSVKAAEAYKTATQKKRFVEQLGERMDQKYISKSDFLVRGHLAPRADFPMHFLQRATYIYGNVAPQWQRGNAGDWASLEESIRNRVARLGYPVQIYTGTYGVLTLNDIDGEPVEMYLAHDDNNNGLIPVPKYYYKVLHDPVERTAIAFVYINSPYYKKRQIQNSTFCRDMCTNNGLLSWVEWRPNDGFTSFCCDYREFAEKIQHLEIYLKDQVKGLFY